jgi:restriction system protein
MTPREFEQLVANHYQNEGYETEITPYSGDYGVDIIAQKGEERIAIQAKMYGNSARKVNRETVMQLFGAMAYRQCNKAVIATDGTCMTDAIEVANRLGLEILYLNSMGIIVRQHEELVNEKELPTTNINDVIAFDEMWKRYIMPLSGRTITNDGLTNKIISVDWGGLTRMTSKGNIGKISIEEFQLAYELLVKNGSVERVLINQHAKRCSSGIVLVLSQVPFIGVQNKPKTMLYLKGNK